MCAVHARAVRALRGAHYPPDALEAWASRAHPEAVAAADPAHHLVLAETATPKGMRVAGYGRLHVAEGTIEAIYVDPDFAGQGVGGLLARALEREGRARGLPGLVVDASLNAVPFYRALGFVEKGIDRHALGPGVAIDCIVMEKRFRPAVPVRE